MINLRKKQAILDILLLVGIATVAIFLFIKHGVLYTGVDMGFHLNRISEVYNTLQSGHLFSYLNTQSLNNLGAPVNMTYGSLPYYPFAIAMLVVKNKIIATYLGIYVLLLSTSVVAYLIAYRFWNSRYKSILFAVLYTYSVYSFNFYFGTFGLGQVSAMLFLPMVAYGAYAIFFANIRDWWMLSLGMTGVIYTHLLSTVMYSSLVVLILLTAIIKTRELRRYFYFVMSIVVTIATTLFYWVSFISVYSKTAVFTTDFKAIAGENIDTFSVALINSILGIVLVTAFIISLFVWKKFFIFEKYLVMYTLIYLVLLTNISNFLWYYISKTPLIMLQWSGRFRVLLVFLVVVIIVSVSDRVFNEKFSEKVYCGMLISLSGLLWLSNSIDFCNSRIDYRELDYRPTVTRSLPFSNFKISNNESYNNLVGKNYNGVGSLDYWPQKAVNHYVDLENHVAIINGQPKVINSKGIVNGVVFKNVLVSQKSEIDLPFLAYNGFEYKVYANKKQVNPKISSRHTLLIDLDKGNFNIKVLYVPNTKIKIAKIISIATIFILLIYSGLNFKRYNNKMKRTHKVDDLI